MEDNKDSEYNIYGWLMWDKTEKDGANNPFFVFGESNPVKPVAEQMKYGGDHQGHYWASMPLYKKSTYK